MEMPGGLAALELAAFFALIAGAGLIAGVIAGLLGVGGGIVLVPVLYYVFGAFDVPEAVRMHVAVATSLASIVPTSLRSLSGHRRRGAVDDAILRAFAPGLALGAIAGAVVADLVSGAVLTAVFGALAIAVALNMLAGRADWRLADAMPAGAGALGLGGAIGLLSAMMGIGGGVFGVTAMTLCGVAIHRAVGTASGFGVLIAAPGTLAMIAAGWNETGLPPLSLGYVNLIALGAIVPATFIATPWGVALAHRAPTEVLRRVFAVFVLLTAVRLLVDAFGWTA